MTNIALAIKTYPEIKENIKEVFIMGGNFRGENWTIHEFIVTRNLN